MTEISNNSQNSSNISNEPANKIMRVLKRDGTDEEVSFDKIIRRVKNLSGGLQVNSTKVAQKVIENIFDGVTTAELDELSAQIAFSMSTEHPDYGLLAGKITVSNHQKNTPKSFYRAMKILFDHQDVHGKPAPLICKEVFEVVRKYKKELEDAIDYNRDFFYDYFGFKTLQRSYLMKVNGEYVERIQHMWMRVSLGIHKDDNNLKSAIETYNLMSQKYFTHATPTLYNAGTPRPQLSSCFLLSMADDSIDGIFSTLKQCSLISKWAGGIGLHIHNIRAKGTPIRGTNGTSNGIVPMLKVFNHTARYVDQCLDPESIVYTKEGPKAIKNIMIGDKIVANDGNLYRISKILDSDYEGKFYNIDVKHTIENLKLTDWHPLWVIKNNKYYQRKFDSIINSLDKNLIKPEFIEVKNIEKNDFVGFPIPKYTKDIPELTEDDCRMYGILLGDGCLSQGNNLAYVALNTDSKKEAIVFVERYLREKNIHITYTKRDKNYVRLTWSRTNKFKFTREMIYDENSEKRVDKVFLHLPKNKSLQLIKGILETDGKVKDYQIVLEMTSRNIIESVRYILLRLGILTSGTIRDRIGKVSKYKNITTKKLSNLLIIPKTKLICDLFEGINESKSFTFFEYEGMLYSIVNNVSFQDDYKGRVIDIEVGNEDHHNFLTHSGLVMNGGGKRNGSFAIYIEPWHADILDFLELRKNHGDEEMIARDLFYALWISDLFMKRVEQDGNWSLMCPDVCQGLSDVYGDEFEELYTKYENEGLYVQQLPARKVWNAILVAQIETGTPYMLYKDACNKKSNQKNLGTIKSSNLCVAPDTMILTKTGYYPISELKDKNVSVWNGCEWSETQVKQTSDNSELIKISFSNGVKLECTKYHKFYIQEKYGNVEPKEIRAVDLKEGMKLFKTPSYPIIREGNEDYKYPYTAGFHSGDGTYNNKNYELKRCNFKALDNKNYCKRHISYDTKEEYDANDRKCHANSGEKLPSLALYGEKIKLIPYLDKRFEVEPEKYENIKDYKNKKIVLSLPVDLPEKYDVPINCSLDIKLKWFAGYADSDGHLSKNGDNESLQIGSINKEFLLKVRLMLQTMGVDVKITKLNSKREVEMPDGHGGLKKYECKKIYRILLSSMDLYNLYNIGFKTHRIKYNYNKPNRDARQFIKVKSVKENKKYSPTYCFNEAKRHRGIFNGIETGNCTEIIEYTSPEETAVCNLASINLRSFVSLEDEENPTYNFAKLHDVTKVITRNLNRVIDVNYYPVPEAENSNKKHRPIGIGVQGLADTFCLMRYPFDSDNAKQLNKEIFETIYHAAVESSCELASERETEILEYKQLTMIENRTKDIRKRINNILKRTSFTQEELTRDKYAGSYSSYLYNGGCPASKGILQYDMWNVKPSPRYNWTELKENIEKYGLRNSLLVAPMPTASTSQILGNNECFEPFTSNMYTRRTLAGEFIIINKYLMKDLIKLGLWNEEMKYKLMAYEGSVQNIPEIPQDIKDLYKTVWEIKQRYIIDMAADRGAFIDQSQSMNLFIREPTIGILTSMHFHGWKKGLKTGQYYLRTKPVARAQQFTVDPNLVKQLNNSNSSQAPSSPSLNPKATPSGSKSPNMKPKKPIKQCLRDNPDCEACGS